MVVVDRNDMDVISQSEIGGSMAGMHEQFSSLALVKEQIAESLQDAEANLERYVEETGSESQLKQALAELSQLRGVFHMTNLPAAAMLCDELQQLGMHIIAHPDRNNETLLASISNAIMVLKHYLEYVDTRSRSLPVLLVPTINEVRSLLSKSFLNESVFFELEVAQPEWPVIRDAEPQPEALLQRGRRQRHLYQVGLVGLFRNENLATHCRMMSDAVQNLAEMTGNAPMSRLWWLVMGVLEAVRDNHVTLSTARKSLLGAVDRSIRHLLQNPADLQREPAEALVRECVYIASLVPEASGHLAEIQTRYRINTNGLTNSLLDAEYSVMRGPGGSVIKSVAEALNEELGQIKDMLDLGARGATADHETFNEVADIMVRVANTLLMLGLKDASETFRDKSGLVREWSAEAVDADSEEFNAVADSLLFVENSIATLMPRRGPGKHLRDDSTAEAIKSGMSISQLDTARNIVVVEARAGLSLAKRSIAAFIDSNWDGMHLNNVPSTLKAVWGGLLFLQLGRAAAVVGECSTFIDNALLKEATPPSQTVLETLADAITSIDYYLEGIEEDKPISEGVLDVAEESMQDLGYPVKAA